MQRLKDEGGVVAVSAAILITVLLAMAALAVDVSASWARKHQLQNGADAAALAIAQNYARGATSGAQATADSYASDNSYGGTTNVTVTGPSGGEVTVKVTDPTYQHWFGPVIGKDSSEIGAEATAKYGWPTGGSTFPLTFSYCEWHAQTGGLSSTTPQVIKLSKKSGSDCTGPSGLPLPGGFGWVDPSGGCTKASMINNILSSDTGNSPPSACSASDFDALIGTTILIPIFDNATGSGTHGEYRVYGYAAFTFLDYDFKGTYKGNGTITSSECKSAERCIKGYFTHYADLNEVLEIGVGGPQLGAAVVTLEK